MAEPTLNLSYDDLAKALSDYMGWGFAVPTDSGELARVDAFIQEGLRRFYFNEMGHQWSFLKPSATLTTSLESTATTGTSGTTLKDSTAPFDSSMVGATVTFSTSGNTYTVEAYVSTSQLTLTESLDAADTVDEAFTITGFSVYDLPDDFAGMACRQLTFAEQTRHEPIIIISDDLLRQKAQEDNTTRRPQFATVRAKAHSGSDTASQRYEIQLWPIPDSAYEIQYAYHILVGKLASGKYPPGGADHASTIKALCLAVAEEEGNDEVGHHAEKAARLLAASVKRDIDTKAPDFLGNMNRTTDEESDWAWRHVRTAGVEYVV